MCPRCGPTSSAPSQVLCPVQEICWRPGLQPEEGHQGCACVCAHTISGRASLCREAGVGEPPSPGENSRLQRANLRTPCVSPQLPPSPAWEPSHSKAGKPENRQGRGTRREGHRGSLGILPPHPLQGCSYSFSNYHTRISHTTQSNEVVKIQSFYGEQIEKSINTYPSITSADRNHRKGKNKHK